MDSGDPIATISARIRTLEPENASKIIGYFLLQDITNSDLIRLAFSTDKVLKELCEEAKSVLGIYSLNHARPFNPHHQSLSQSSPRNEFLDFSRNPNPLSPSLTSNTFGYNPNFHHEGSSQQQQQQWSNHFPFADFNKRSFSVNEPGYQFLPGGLVDGFGSPGGLGSPSERISPNQQQRMIAAHGSPMSNIQGSGQFGVQGGFGSPSEQQRMIAAQFMGDFGSPMSNIRGSGQFGVQGGFGSPSEQQRMIAAQFMGDFGSPMSNIQGSGQFGVEGRQAKRYPASHQIYMTFPSESSFSDEDVKTYFSNFGPVKDVSFPYQEQRTFGFVTFANAETVRTILAGRRLHIIGGSRVTVKPCKQKETIPQKQGPGQFGVQGRQEKRYSVSHQLYLTFPPESSFTDKDVSTYFGNFGPVIDVRIPNQEQRRFGFVTFDNAETVTTVLAQGNPHLIGESPVIVKQYQRKETIPQDSGQQQQLNQLLERGNLLHHPSLSGMDPRDQDECRFGPRMSRNRTQEMLQRNTEQADLQQGIEVEHQRRRQERSLENTRPDSLFGSTKKSGETRQTESDTKEIKKASPDQSA